MQNVHATRFRRHMKECTCVYDLLVLARQSLDIHVLRVMFK